MKLRNAAFALVGWYIVAPPPSVNLSAPISRWQILGSYDTAAECESELAYDRAQAHEQTNNTEIAIRPSWQRLSPEQRQDASIRMIHGLCVSTDDPRLAK
jgi:hypothetical protein